MKREFRILLVDDDRELCESLAAIIEQKGYVAETAFSAEEALQKLIADDGFNLVFLDLILPQMNGIEFLEQLQAKSEKRPAVIMITGHGSVESAVKAMKLGAADYLEKPVNPEEMFLLIAREIQRQKLLDQTAYFMKELSEKYSIENIVGRSPLMQEVFEKVRSVADTDVAVLITGESGTGKELLANHIHYSSSRRDGPLEKLSCASLAQGVIESELFGHEKGAYTGAECTKPGRFELAHNGTIFLDEVGDIPLPFQAKLLRVLQSREFERVGGVQKLTSDFRLITATNQNLQDNIRKGLFRRDLYYRINVMEIELPPLRKRKEDIPDLLAHFIRIYSEKTNKKVHGSAEGVLDALQSYDWPGNVREFKNVIERAFVYCRGNVIEMQHLPKFIHSGHAAPLDLSGLPTRSLQEVERSLIVLALDEARGNLTHAAKSLGIGRMTLRSKLKRYGLLSS
jgi:DNA-binding NtrC family response regulator